MDTSRVTHVRGASYGDIRYSSSPGRDVRDNINYRTARDVRRDYHLCDTTLWLTHTEYVRNGENSSYALVDLVAVRVEFIVLMGMYIYSYQVWYTAGLVNPFAEYLVIGNR